MTDSQPEADLSTTVNTPTDPPASGAGTTVVAAAPTTTPSAPPQSSNADRREHPTNKAEWLNSFYMTERGSGATNDRGTGQMTINEFSKIKTLSGEHAYWEDCHINWALELIHRKYAELEGVVITPTFWCDQLYVAGMNPHHIAPVDSSDYRQNWAHIADALRNGTIVVLPVNNGYGGNEEIGKAYTKAQETIEKAKEFAKTATEEAEKAEDDAEKATTDAERADKEAKEADEGGDKAEEAVKEAKDAAKKANEAAQEKMSAAKNKRQTAGEADEALKKAKDGSLRGYLGSGSHWSYIVVDRRDAENPRAHYVDSLVSPQRRPNGRWAVAGINFNGRVAGAVLRGFDRLLGLRESGFEAHTLKFIPHQFRDNACKHDTGSCGPHIYAFLDHILGSKTTLIDPGMHTTFDVAASRARRAREFNFDSRTARSRFADNLFAERKRYEERRPDLAVSNLTSGVLNSILTADDVIRFATGSKSSSSQSHTGDSGNDHGKGKQAKRDRNEKADPNTPDIYLGRNRYRNVPRNDTNIFPPLAADDKYTKPAKMTNIPDFETARLPTLKTWFNANFREDDRPDYKSENWETECRARLHVKIKKSLLGQSDNNLENIWSKDRVVFDPNNTEYTNLRKEFEKKEDKRPMYGVMREMLMRHYMTKEAVDELLKILKKFKVKEPAAGDKRKRDDDDDESSDDDSNGGGPGNSGNNGKHAKHSKGGPGGGSGGKHTKPQDFQTIANEDINFTSMKSGNVLQWWNKVVNQGSRNFLGSKLTIERVRVCLHRAFNGKFTRNNLGRDAAPIYLKRLNLKDSEGYYGILEDLNELTDGVKMLPKRLEWYPDYYLLERNIIPAQNSDESSDESSDEDDAAAGALDPEQNAGSLNGNSSGGNNGSTGPLPIKAPNTTSSKRKHEGDSNTAVKKLKITFKPLKKPASEDVGEEEDAPGGIDASVSLSSELSSLSELFDD